MQDTFGPKLEEARTRQGISIREASDATKIRGDFLASFETSHADFDMHEIYKRGFIKLYARYLKLNPEEILKEYTAYKLGSSKSTKKDTNREVLGRMEITSQDDMFPTQSTLPLNNVDPISPYKRNYEDENENLGIPDTKSLYLKIGLTLGGTLAAFTAIAILIASFTRPSPVEINTDLLPETSFQANNIDFSSSIDPIAAGVMENLTLTSDDEVDVVVRQEDDKQHLYSGHLKPNKPITLTRKGPVKVRFSNGSSLTIEKPNGQKVRPGQEGVGWIEI